ncbi:type VI secretion system protein [Variovorax rhizosphaerae]|uniref:Type VI secretion system protein n=1 Tax=Variovorax rhizosphaerae TaxID=1836200 RepID=A0ABU8WP29_9BURK
MNALPHRFWLLTVLCAVAFALLWWWTLGRRRSQRLRTLRGLLAKSDIDDADTALAALPQALSEADAADISKPWVMFIGNAAANLPGLLAIEAQPWMFWQGLVRPEMAAIVMGPAAVSNGVAGQRARGLWLRALMALAEQRPALPLNGIVVCVEARELLQPPQTTAPLAERLQRVLRETTQLLELRLPVYVLVTGLERLAGHVEVCEVLAPQVLAQALGHRLPEPGSGAATPGHSAGERFDALFATLSTRLRALGAGLLLEHPDAPAARLASHQWVEQLLALEPALRELVVKLFEPANDGSPACFWRGLYLTGASSPQSQAAFSSDLLRRFLPADQSLARRHRSS